MREPLQDLQPWSEKKTRQKEAINLSNNATNYSLYYNYQTPKNMQILLLQLRSWVPNFQRIQNFRLHSYFNLCSSAIEVYYQDIILNEIASDESHFILRSFWFGKLQQIWQFFTLWIFNFLKTNVSTHGFRDGAVKLSWQEGPNSYYGRKRKLVYELRKCYEITSRREYATLVLQNPRSNPTDRRRTLITKERYEFEF